MDEKVCFKLTCCSNFSKYFYIKTLIDCDYNMKILTISIHTMPLSAWNYNNCNWCVNFMYLQLYFLKLWNMLCKTCISKYVFKCILKTCGILILCNEAKELPIGYHWFK
jgi:hypothetical protein